MVGAIVGAAIGGGIGLIIGGALAGGTWFEPGNVWIQLRWAGILALIGALLGGAISYVVV